MKEKVEVADVRSREIKRNLLIVGFLCISSVLELNKSVALRSAGPSIESKSYVTNSAVSLIGSLILERDIEVCFVVLTSNSSPTSRSRKSKGRLPTNKVVLFAASLGSVLE